MGGLRLVDKWRRLGGTSIVNTIPGDCTAGFQAAINACNPGDTLCVPAGVYTVSAPAPGTYSILSLPFGIKIEGDGVGETIIKVANACPTYHWLLGPPNNATDLSDLEICDLTFDHNISNNAITNEAEIIAWPEYSCGTYVGSDINLHDLEVINASSVNNIVVNGLACSDVSIDHITCSNMGDDPNHVVHDASLIYVVADTFSVSNCELDGDDSDNPASATAIEVHGTDYTVQNNTLANWVTGMNVVGDFFGGAQNCLITLNTITDVRHGVMLWSYQEPPHTTGYGIDGMTISYNTIEIIPYGLVADTHSRGGIDTQWDSDLDINDLLIDHNTITDTLETVSGGSNDVSLGIGWYSNTGNVLSNSFITNNTVTNFPNAGIRLSYCGIDTVSITDNTLIDCGSSKVAGIGETERPPMVIRPTTVADLDISDNTFIDDIAVTRIPFWMYLRASVSSSGVEIHDNSYTMTGDKVMFERQFRVADDVIQPLFTDRVTGFVVPTHVVDDASTIIDGVYTWTVDVTGLIWTKLRTGDTLLTVYPDAHVESTSVDGYVRMESEDTYANLKAAAGDGYNSSLTNGNVIRAQSTSTASKFDRLHRSILCFDCSALPPGAVVDEARLGLYVTNKLNDLAWSNTDAGMALVSAAPASNVALAAGDFDSLGSTRFAPDIPYSSITAAAYNYFQLNASGLAAIVDGVSKFGVRHVADLDTASPGWITGAKNTSVNIYYADNGSLKPTLEIQYHV